MNHDYNGNLGSQDLVIRSLEPDEWNAYKNLCLEALEREPQAFGFTYAAATQMQDVYWRLRLFEAKSPKSMSSAWMLFAVKNGIPVGMVAACTGASGCIDLFSVYVTAAERGRAIARTLMETIIQDIQRDYGSYGSCGDHGDQDRPTRQTTLTLNVNRDQQAAVHLYTALGFTTTGETTTVLGDGKEHCQYRMERALA